jgi:hypothetical protein
MDLCKDCAAVLHGRLQRNPTQLVHSQHETYGPASCPECGAKWYHVRGGMVLLGKRIGPKRALSANPIPRTRRTTG